MNMRLRRCTLGVLIYLSCPVSADETGSGASSKRWRYFFREAQFNRLLLDLAKEHPSKSFIVRGATILTMAGEAALVDHSVVVDEPLSVSPDDIAAHRDAWVDEWTEIVVR